MENAVKRLCTMLHRCLGAAIPLVALCALSASAAAPKPLSSDPSLLNGTLSNGLSYTIKHHERPEDRVSMRLLVKAGALDEEDDQQGIAHLVEHMAFNGTEHFPGNEIISFLESKGVGFGRHLNASTGTTRTLYKLDIALEGKNFNTAMMVLRDWAGGVVFDAEELEKERGVVLEEARARNTPEFQLYLQLKDIYYAGSKYKDRTPIGDLEIVKNVPLKRVKAFYDDWYRPDLMHVVIVGDVDLKATQQMVVETFGGLKNGSKRQRASRNVPLIEGTRSIAVGDPELTRFAAGVTFFEPYRPMQSEADFREATVRSVLTRLFRLRSRELQRRNNPAAQSVTLKAGTQGDNLRTYDFTVSYTDAGRSLEAFGLLSRMLYGIERYGFDREEFTTVIKDMEAANANHLKSAESTTSARHADTIVKNLLNESVTLDTATQVALTERFLKEITLDEVMQAYRKIVAGTSRLIVLTVDDAASVSAADAEKVFADARQKVVPREKSEALPSRIVTETLKPAGVREIYHADYDYYEFFLDNGVRVVFKPSDYDKERVVFQAISPGGFSLYPTQELVNAKLASSVIGRSGYDRFDALQVRKINAGKKLKLRPSVGRYRETLSGSCASSDFEYLMESVYLITSKPRFDETVFTNFKHQTAQGLRNAQRRPEMVFAKELKRFRYDGHKRFLPLEEGDLKSLDEETMVRIFHERFSDLNNFVVVLVGDLDKERVKRHIATYLGNVPTASREERYRFSGVKPVTGKREFVRMMGSDPKSSVALSYQTDVEYSVDESIRLSVMGDVLKTKLRELVREEKSGVYGISVKTRLAREPYGNATVAISFTCDPERRAELIRYVEETIKSLAEKPVDQTYVDAALKQRLLSFKEGRKMPRFWMSRLSDHYYYGDDLKDIETHEARLQAVTPKAVLQSVRKYLQTENVLKAELNPAGEEG